ncbi:uridine 5'-monophosphate synthase-like [Fundulus heteroclitus]|uniref:uridine 5'-monophosphate synthase-like n=1 Tax=Fundulus heteroclitus TaxID=8078 RepID=UPI00165C8FFE|nr:uridine 5'-monophosphate synthase-like [Fundulus heteroclitus]
MANIDSLILKLYDVNAMKFDEYELMTGLKSPIYIDFRVLVSHPALMNEVSSLMYQSPYTALPLATIICSINELPMVIKRKEAKDYEPKKMVEGSFLVLGQQYTTSEETINKGSDAIFEGQGILEVPIGLKERTRSVDRLVHFGCADKVEAAEL